MRKICAPLASLAALLVSTAAAARQEVTVLEFAEHGQVVAVEVLRTPGVWEGQIIAGAFAGGWAARIETSAGEVLLANSGFATLQSLPLGNGSRIVHLGTQLLECGGEVAPPGPDQVDGGIAGACDDGTVVDVLLKWTPVAQTQAGGPVAIRALAEAAVAMSNHLYIASGVNVHMRAVGYGLTQSTFIDSSSNVLTSLRSNSSIRAERTSLGADLVSLITGPNPMYSGIAYLGGASDPEAGYSVVVWAHIPTLVFTHEVGHNQGCCHAPGDGGGCEGGGLFPFSAAHRFQASNDIQYRTVMAYPPGRLIPRLSSPLVTYLGSPTGLPLADNARTVRETSLTVANYRCGAPLSGIVIDSPLLPGPEAGATVSFTWQAVPPAAAGSQVLLVARAVGDLGDSDESMTLRIGTRELGIVIGGSGFDCAIQSRLTAIPAEYFNSAIGSGTSVEFGLRASSGVGPCAASEISLELRYQPSSETWCPSDINRDSQIDGEDLSYLLSAWGTDGQGQYESDLSGDGTVDGVDLAMVLGAWGPSCGLPAPTLESVAPASVPAMGGSTITLTGSGLIGATQVMVGGVAATGLQIVNATTVTAVAPQGPSGPKDVSVMTPRGTATLGAALRYAHVTAPAWAESLDALPNPVVVRDPALRAAIAATGLAWRVRDRSTGIEMVLIPPGSFDRGCSASNEHACASDESPVHRVTLTHGFYMGRYEVTTAEWSRRMGASDCPEPLLLDLQPEECVSWDRSQQFLQQAGMRLPTEAEWEYAYRAGTATAFHGAPAFPSGTNADIGLRDIAWFGALVSSPPQAVGRRAGNGLGLHDMSGNVAEWVSDWYGPYPSGAVTDPTGPMSGTFRVLRGGSIFSDSGRCRASSRGFDAPTANHGFRVARTATSELALYSVQPSNGPTSGGTSITLTGANLSSTTGVTIGGVAATNVQVISPTQVTAVTPAGAAGAQDLTVTTSAGTLTRAGGFTYLPTGVPTITTVTPNEGAAAGGTLITISGTSLSGVMDVTVGGASATNVRVLGPTAVMATTPPGAPGTQDVVITTPGGSASIAGAFTYRFAGDECAAAVPATVGANAFETVTATTSADPVVSSQCADTGLDWGTTNKDIWFTYVAPSNGSLAVDTCDPSSFDTSIVLYSGSSCGAKTQIACNGDAAGAAACQPYYSRIGPIAVSAGTRYWIRIGGWDAGSGPAVGSGTMNLQFTPAPAPTIASVAPGSGLASGGTTITLTGTNLAGVTSVRVGGVAATNIQVTSSTVLKAVTPAGTLGAQDVTVTTPDGTATLAGAFRYVLVVEGDDCSNAVTAVEGANPFDTTYATTSADPVNDSQCLKTALDWGNANKDVWFRFVAPGNGLMLVETCDPTSFDTSIVLYSGSSCATKVQIACNGDGPEAFDCQPLYSSGGPLTVTGGSTYWIRIGGWDGDGVSGPEFGTGSLNLYFVEYPVPTIASVSPTSGPSTGGTSITLTGTNLLGATSVAVGGAMATSVQVTSPTSITAVTPPGTAGARDVTVTTPGGTATLSGGFAYILASAGDECAVALPAVVGANAFSTVNATTSLDPVDELQCQGTFLVWGSGNKDVWFKFVAPGNGLLTVDTCNPSSFDTSMVLYAGEDCGSKSQIACNGDGIYSPGCQIYFSSIGPVIATGGTTYWIRIGAWNGSSSGPPTGSGTLNLQFVEFLPPTLASVSPSSGSTVGGTLVTLTGTNLAGVTSVQVGGVAATGVQVVNSTTVRAVTPPGVPGARDVTVTAPGGIATLAGGFSYLPTGGGSDECFAATAATVGANPFSTVNSTPSWDPVEPSQCPGTFLDWGTANRDVWFRFDALTSGFLTIDTCLPAGFDTSMVLYIGPSCGSMFQIACNGDGGDAFGCQPHHSRIGPIAVAGGTTCWIRIGGRDLGTGPATGSGALNVMFASMDGGGP